VQTGVPFGEVAAARDFLQVEAKVERPAHETPYRPIEGFASSRSEVSGRRLWGLFAQRFGAAENFARDHFVLNYCPLAFLENARNVTPDKLAKSEVAPLYAACDDYLRAVVDLMQPEWVIGVGKFARKQAEKALAGRALKFGDILHPSPASPAANKGWEPIATAQLEGLGIWPTGESAIAKTRRSA